MSKKLNKLKEMENDSYSFNKTAEPFPELQNEKEKPPLSPCSHDSTALFIIV